MERGRGRNAGPLLFLFLTSSPSSASSSTAHAQKSKPKSQISVLAPLLPSCTFFRLLWRFRHAFGPAGSQKAGRAVKKLAVRLLHASWRFHFLFLALSLSRFLSLLSLSPAPSLSRIHTHNLTSEGCCRRCSIPHCSPLFFCSLLFALR